MSDQPLEVCQNRVFLLGSCGMRETPLKALTGQNVVMDQNFDET